MTIRDRLIEALMNENPRWDHIRAGEVLDAMLVVLADNADEWAVATKDRLLAVLVQHGTGSLESDRIELRYIKFIPRPKKDGLHDSGYRFIKLIGVDKDNQEHDLGEWHDHLIVQPQCNIDVEPDGTIRIMPWSNVKFYASENRGWFTSTAWIHEDGRFD